LPIVDGLYIIAGDLELAIQRLMDYIVFGRRVLIA
jgi:hypothetical protein